MNTNKFKVGEEVAIRAFIVKNDGQDVLPYQVETTSGDLKFFNERDLSPLFDAVPQPATDVNRTEILTRLVEAYVRKEGFPTTSTVKALSETVNHIIELSKTPTND